MKFKQINNVVREASEHSYKVNIQIICFFSVSNERLQVSNCSIFISSCTSISLDNCQSVYYIWLLNPAPCTLSFHTSEEIRERREDSNTIQLFICNSIFVPWIYSCMYVLNVTYITWIKKSSQQNALFNFLWTNSFLLTDWYRPCHWSEFPV